ncbi:hypothetical protein CEQ21_00415 [Niallia circulans]|uniref:Uncharacterized protein n=1 Tax=Niallia circulans TaxID=1397 RepID=A0A553SR62_NIACI|nr:hypothetical protein [Niallia circulans]TRZ39475.1 hypothetical protein CEQ21_00415 [Niallia circulans]
MLETIKRIKWKTAVNMGILFYTLTVLLHVLILCGVIPFTIVNGGHSQDFGTQVPISIMNLTISIIGGVFTLVIGRIVTKRKRGITMVCWFFVALWSFGFAQQLVGTTFERLFCSIILLLGVIANLRMAVGK